MALSSINISIENNPYKGCIEIFCESDIVSLGDISYLLIYKRKNGTTDDYVRIYEKEINSVNDLNFNDIDIASRSGMTYQYFVELTDGNSTDYTALEYATISNVKCWFEGLFIGNYEKQYMAHLNCKTSTTRNTQVSYVTTIASRTPYRVSNAFTNYVTGQSSGLFAPLDQYNQPDPQSTKEYINEVVDFLSDGTDKILKTSDGQVWYVSIDSQISVPFDEYYKGSCEISFNWTEIGDVPVVKKVTTE